MALETLYPVGSIYIGIMDECPLAALFGTWTKIEGRYLLASGSLVGGSEEEVYSAGYTAEAGLPNITGELSDLDSDVNAESFGELHIGTISVSGCIEVASKSQCACPDAGPAVEMVGGFKIDASKSNEIYGCSETVRPPSYCVNVWRRDL